MAIKPRDIRKMAQTKETNAKIPVPIFTDKSPIPSRRGIGFGPVPPKICNTIYNTRDNGYNIADILAGTHGPKLNDHCDHIDRVLGLTDFDVAQNSANFGGLVSLVIHLDGRTNDS